MYKVLTVSLLAVIQLPMYMINDNLDSIYMCIVSLREKRNKSYVHTINIFFHYSLISDYKMTDTFPGTQVKVLIKFKKVFVLKLDIFWQIVAVAIAG